MAAGLFVKGLLHVARATGMEASRSKPGGLRQIGCLYPRLASLPPLLNQGHHLVLCDSHDSASHAACIMPPGLS